MAIGGDLENISFGYPDKHIGEIIDISGCPLHVPIIEECIEVMTPLIKEFKIQPYDMRNQRGELKYIHFITNRDQTEIMVRFVLRSLEARERVPKLLNKLQLEMPKVKVGSYSIQPDHKAVLEGEVEYFLTDQRSIVEIYNNISFHIGPRSFFQVTPEIAEILYRRVEEFIKTHHVQSLLDLYCGVGGFGIHAARAGARVHGVEISDEAIYLAKMNAVPFPNTSYEVRDADHMLSDDLRGYEAILVNPPRRGLTLECIKFILRASPKYLIYSSCSPEVQAKEWSQFEKDFEIIHREAFDMFPMNNHFESLIIAKKK
ncbi:MAG: 23S rRNA (uracil(747)-C(5))-methyltransferase RlmC [Bacteriovoracaceae bacterium]